MMRINSAEELEVCEEVGRGAFGVVYRGLIKATSEEVAIKQIDLESEQADLIEVNKEIQIISECRIPQITRFMGCFVKQYKLWVIMEYVNGGSLFELLIPGAVTNEGTILTIVNEILIALLYLHNQGKIHRDLKSQNILLNRNGEVKLTDFGVSTQLSSNFSRRNTTVGTPYWMAPEVILNNNGGHSYKADIWSLGCCAYELFTGKPPLQNQYPPMKALRQISKCHDDQDFVGLIGLDEMVGISSTFKDFLHQCFIVDPKERSSASKLLKHKFITQHSSNKEIQKKELNKLITNKQLWDQEHHVAKIQNFYVPTEMKKNQNKWLGQSNEESKTIKFDLSLIYDGESDSREGSEEAASGGVGTSSSTGTSIPSSTTSSSSPQLPEKLDAKQESPALHYNSLSRIDTKQENLKKTLKPELNKIVNKVFHKLESKNSLLTEQYDSLVLLNNSILNLVNFMQDNQIEKSPKVLICQYFRYFFKELMRENPSENRTMLQRLIIPLVVLVGNNKNLQTIRQDKTQTQTQFDEIELSLMNSWIGKMLDGEIESVVVH